MSNLATNDRPEAPLFSDGLGERVVAADGATGELLQILRLRPNLTAVPSFEFALRERTARLANFRHAYYARVRRVDRAMAPTSALAIVSDHLEGTRLSDILRVAQEKQLQLDINAALCLIRQLVPAIALLHENARDVAHGLIAPERLIVTPNARLVIVEHVLGAAIEQLQFGRDRLWQEFRVAMPPSAGLPRFDHRADVTGMGLVSLALILGRPLRADEFPHRLPDLLNQARERSALGEEQPLSPPLRAWLERALQIDVRRSFASAPEALAALEEVVSDGGMYVAAPVALETFLSRYIASLLEPPTPEPVAHVDPVVPVTSRPVEAPVVKPTPSEPVKPAEKDVEVRFDAVVAQHTPPVTTNQPVVQKRDSTPVGPRELTDLLGPDPLPIADPIGAAPPKPLFNPDAPFTATPAEPAPPRQPGNVHAYGRIAALVALVLVLGGGGLFGYKMLGNSAVPPAMGALNVQSNPAGVDIFVDGVAKGRTPRAHRRRPRFAHPRAAWQGRATSHSVERYRRRRGVSVSRVRRSAGDRPARRAVGSAGSEGARRRYRARRRPGHDFRSHARRSQGRAAERRRNGGTPHGHGSGWRYRVAGRTRSVRLSRRARYLVGCRSRLRSPRRFANRVGSSARQMPSVS